MHCKICGDSGHDKRTCQKKTGDGDATEARSQVPKAKEVGPSVSKERDGIRRVLRQTSI